MAFRLSKTQAKDLARYRQNAVHVRRYVEADLRRCNEAVAQAVAALNVSVDGYNKQVAAARAFAEAVAEESRGEYDERTDGWRDGENGQAADSWISEWEGVALSDLERACLPEVVRADLLPSKRWADEELAGLPEEAQ